MSKKKSYGTRWLLNKDIRDVEHIECSAFGTNAWSKRKISQTLNKKNTVGIVCEYKEEVRGYIIYSLYKDHIEIVRMVVDPLYRREGVGTAIINRMIEKIGRNIKMEFIDIKVPEDNLDLQLFLKNNKFRACSIIKGGYEESDKYEFVYRESVFS